MEAIIRKLQEELGRIAEYTLDHTYLDNVLKIKARCEGLDIKPAKSLSLILRYLYLTDGPINLKNPQFNPAADAELLTPGELVMVRYAPMETRGFSFWTMPTGVTMWRTSSCSAPTVTKSKAEFLIGQAKNGRRSRLPRKSPDPSPDPVAGAAGYEFAGGKGQSPEDCGLNYTGIPVPTDECGPGLLSVGASFATTA